MRMTWIWTCVKLGHSNTRVWDVTSRMLVYKGLPATIKNLRKVCDPIPCLGLL